MDILHQLAPLGIIYRTDLWRRLPIFISVKRIGALERLLSCLF